ncbi:hypothetical protein G7Y89_g12030 [Cudoniella acicularis]|uniref:Uncharacterized protein n=1 Tax=Cudoniella acicularis TaxID=354080 RepID=A0A8H4RB84_9HELO|nr:hypothetical protein G7Y89_g12030 [Cudoniella acicularis]
MDQYCRYYLTPKYRPILASINRPKPNSIAKHIAHPSESEWNLSRGNSHHFSNFPLDIKLMIFEMLLVIPPRKSIRPEVISSDLKRIWSMPDYLIFQVNDLEFNTESVIRYFNRRDRQGSCTEHRKVARKIIYASVPRTSSEIFLGWFSMLYGNNTFRFGMTHPGFDSCPPYMRPEDRGLWCPNPTKPSRRHKNLRRKIDKVVIQIRSQCHILKPHGWAYYDPFLRFLNIIEPQNANLFKSIW